MRYRDLSLRTKIQFMIIQITVFNFMSMGAELWSSSVFQDRLRSMIAVNDRMETALARLDGNLNEAEIDSLNYAATRKREDLEARDKMMALVDTNLKDIQSIKQDVISSSELGVMVTLIDQYKKLLKDSDAKMDEEGKIADYNERRMEISRAFDAKVDEATKKLDINKVEETHSMESFEKYCNWFRSAVLVFIIMVGLMYSFEVKRISDSLQEILERVKATAYATMGTSRSVQEASEKVSSATNEQASAVQETVATLNEITAMVNQSVEGAASSADKASVSFHIANEGRQSVNQMRQAMQEIQHNINDMTVQVDSSNKKFEGIVQIINEIVSKTQVINDIVFQTKLLSFNASVEAARAGDHGKGFAVVAEEVGNLAQMSGQAAREIGELLSKSRGNVEQIIRDSKSQMEVLVRQGGDRVKNGADLANRCEEVLQEVVSNVNSVKKLMEEISTAAKEEAEGVHNITIAMNEIDSSTHANSDTAHETMGYSATLAQQAQEMERIIRNLDIVVRGRATAEASRTYAETRAEEPKSKQNVASIRKKTETAGAKREARPEANDPGFDEVA